MAIGFVRTTVASRSNNKNALAMAAYRSGTKLVDERNGNVHDYTKKQGVDSSIILSPIDVASEHWLMERQKLWSIVEANEIRHDAQVCREVTIAIPRELSRDNKIDLVREHVRSSYVDRGMVADINYHDLDSDNPHAHVMLTMRDLNISPTGEITFGKKNRSWNDKKLLKEQRQEWDNLANEYLERAGINERIDTRSYDERGITDLLPQIHLGVAVSSMRERGIATDRGDLFDRIEAHNKDIRAELEQIYQVDAALADIERQIETAKTEVLYTKVIAGVERYGFGQDAPLYIKAIEWQRVNGASDYTEAVKADPHVTIPKNQKNEGVNIDPDVTTPAPGKNWQTTKRQRTSDDLCTVLKLDRIVKMPERMELGRYLIERIDRDVYISHNDRPALILRQNDDRKWVSHLAGDLEIADYQIGLTDAIDRHLRGEPQIIEEVAEPTSAIAPNRSLDLPIEPESEPAVALVKPQPTIAAPEPEPAIKLDVEEDLAVDLDEDDFEYERDRQLMPDYDHGWNLEF